MLTDEWQFDGLVGPTHNYAGLAYGNMASQNNKHAASNPRLAALQGLEKMKFVRDLGVRQAFLPPHTRPVLPALHQLGFRGSKAKMLEDAYKAAPELLASVYSSAFMWVANAATVSPSADTADGKVHFTPANMVSNFHRSLEPQTTAAHLRKIFHDDRYFSVHDPLPSTLRFADEGAANHMRVCQNHSDSGINIFVFGFSGENLVTTKTQPPRQHREAFATIARNHGLDLSRCLFVQQHPDAIDAGVFHHDVIGMNTTRLMMNHEGAFAHKEAFYAELKKQKMNIELNNIEISDKELPIADAVKSYFFNSQLLDLPQGFVLVAPSECEENIRARQTIQSLVEGNKLIQQVHYRDVRESMRNGGGPACLRLRVVLTEEESAAMHQGIILTDARYEELRAWVQTHYRETLSPNDLRDPKLVDEVQAAMEALWPVIGW